ncbi:MAG: potassium transporter TrkG, partial [Vulcanococcus sp.]
MNPSSSNPVRALQRWRHQLTVPQFTVVTGLLVIVLATLLLSTPLCSNSNVGLWQALFTATSAITVTGLSVIDIGEDLTFAGQVVLAGLIITGGLGLMAITTFLQGFVQGRSGLRNRLDKGRALDEFGVGGIGPTFHSILLVALCVMGLGTVVLYSFGFTDIEDPGRRLWAAMFHAISAYNNAGFGLWSNSLESYRDNPVVTGVIAFMIVIGGIGWRVANDIWNNRFRLGRLRRLSLHTRLVIRSTALLIVIGAVGLLITEHIGYGASAMEPYGWLEDLQIVLFQSITTRTAGFNTIPLSAHQITDAGLLLIILLMFIGASPGGTGGGVKTTTFAILMGATRSTLQGRSHVLLHRRQIPDATVLRAVGVTLASALFVVLMALTLGLGNSLGQQQVQSFSFLEKLFTCVSAFGTGGLDLGVTAHL